MKVFGKCVEAKSMYLLKDVLEWEQDSYKNGALKDTSLEKQITFLLVCLL